MEQRVEVAAQAPAAITTLPASGVSSRNWSEPLAFVIMAIVLLIRPAGLFGRGA